MYKVINPYTLKTLKTYEFTSAAKCQEALSSLCWKSNFKKTISQRSNILKSLATLLDKYSPDLIELICAEMGKTIKDAKVELERSSLSAQIAAHEITAQKGMVLDSDSYGTTTNQRMAIVKRFPIGNVLAITPFNFPINLAIHKIVPAFAMGNACLLKPHPQCISSTELLVELCYQAGFEKSDLQLVIPDIPDFQTLISSPKIECISFTGGVGTAYEISKIAGIKKQLYELGGNDALIIFPDGDYKKAASIAVTQRFTCAGQRCTASKRIFVHSSLKEKFKDELLKLTLPLKIGDPLNAETDVGPVVGENAANLVWNRIQSSIENGSKVLLGNKREDNIIYPTILENVRLTDELVAEETFGPVLPLIGFEDKEQVIEQVNSAGLGLQCGVFTQDIDLAKEMYNRIEAGAVIINNGPAFRIDHFPFGGMKQSGIGREGIPWTMEEMSVLKTLVL